MKVTGIFIHPIKSCQRIALEQAEVTPKGFTWDRELMIVDHRQQFMTQRDYPQMAKIQVKLSGKVISLSVQDESLEPFNFEPQLTGNTLAVKIWRDNTIAIDQGDEVAIWLQKALKLSPMQPCRLVRQSPQQLRRINPNYARRSEDQVSFADGYPFLLTNTASLEELNRKIAENNLINISEVPMIRFRPNIVIESDCPFVEDDWKLIKIGEVYFDVVKPCDRCIVTTTDQFTGKRDELKEPLKTLATFRRQAGGVMFGQNMIPQNTGVIHKEDQVQCLEHQ
ncbi:MOSC domain protein [Lyngbya aestuarii BL J]|uniref:MOSC domain protein n=1 Tax=Lyngbya aestuarii BL J TaxID=1348334 RepID=U7Q9Q9_9CYAN|nr:MOSC N-terminal beta barrel domain-containing protein [Lyngbya aestuarii]ERT04548.1 MOSC domain protein [Lyngbya aestuarii BL J]